ncbi:MAG: hypothetical protein APR54_08210 [Candidatus Cloacimonas sp. SDB]|nr:MAG: hypothetical protein APR54_08210 [Candidatus Cloacimonas sp. SDB]
MGSIVAIFLLYHLWINKDIDLKWKLILLILATISAFIYNGIGFYLVAIIVYFVLKWHKVKIR